jgi:hypothetical protein
VLERDISACVSRGAGREGVERERSFVRVHVLPVMVQSSDGFGRWAARRGLDWRGERGPRVWFWWSWGWAKRVQGLGTSKIMARPCLMQIEREGDEIEGWV